MNRIKTKKPEGLNQFNRNLINTIFRFINLFFCFTKVNLSLSKNMSLH